MPSGTHKLLVIDIALLIVKLASLETGYVVLRLARNQLGLFLGTMLS